ncbi:hypothetical protein ACJ73_09152 [Blastomyces percursus]|uniref:Immediate-early protein n=1 Tax=Blastomyces percursus TaxID=1658174 RepID=A0A1J9PCW6_9EURO|nr:hypothetical protein ACJ73_09152 [Blastomyces percursus]
MLSHIVTAARGLFARPDSGVEQDTPPSVDHALKSIPSHPSTQMVPATRRTVFPTPAAEESVAAAADSSPAAKGKRKIATSNHGAESQATKRRKQKGPSDISSRAAKPAETEKRVLKKLPFRTTGPSDIVESDIQPKEDTLNVSTSAPDEADDTTPNSTAKATHVRFGSEELAPVLNGENEQSPEGKKPGESHDMGAESDDDDEAPETIDNAAQLRQLKENARKEAKAKQRTDALNKEKRRERDQRLKAQAVSKPAPASKEHTPSIPQDRRASKDEVLSESSVTIQGSISKPIRSLPMLLPDEILNAEPTSNHSRIPTPPYEIESSSLAHKMSISKSKKLTFLDKVKKRPKDVRIGGTSIRVLESSGNGGSGGVSLPPKSSKGSRRARDNLLTGNRSLPGGGSLRRTTGGASGFVRK